MSGKVTCDRSRIKTGDLIVVNSLAGTLISSIIDPMPLHPGKARWWIPKQIALIVDVGYRETAAVPIKKFKILLGGELWWVSATQVMPIEDEHDTK